MNFVHRDHFESLDRAESHMYVDRIFSNLQLSFHDSPMFR